VKLWRTAEISENLENVSIRARELFLATLLNPKALLFASAIFPVIVWKSGQHYVTHMLVFLLLLIPIAFFWTFLGSILARKTVAGSIRKTCRKRLRWY